MYKINQNDIVSTIDNNFNLNNLPEDVKISTMTICCFVDTIFNKINIAKYIDLSKNIILGVKYGNDKNTNRSIISVKKSSKKKKKNFENAVSIYVNVKKKNNKPVNLKLFTNGSIQMTGCVSINNALDALDKIFIELKKIKAIFVKTKKNKLKIVEKHFVTNYDSLNIQCIKNFKISMINSNFLIDFKINREKLYSLLLEDKYNATYDLGDYAGINLKFNCITNDIEKKITILIFEKGSIIITGAQNCDQINTAYNFINKYLLKNYNKIVKIDNPIIDIKKNIKKN
jgi:TATA-box binding protein (TBP) (component of TFIID and TFIIIB)